MNAGDGSSLQLHSNGHTVCIPADMKAPPKCLRQGLRDWLTANGCVPGTAWKVLFNQVNKLFGGDVAVSAFLESALTATRPVSSATQNPGLAATPQRVTEHGNQQQQPTACFTDSPPRHGIVRPHSMLSPAAVGRSPGPVRRPRHMAAAVLHKFSE